MCGRGGNCRKCLFRQRCGGCSHCEAQLCEESCGSCDTLCPQRPGAPSLLMAMGGSDFELSMGSALDLPSHIPIVPDRLPAMTSLLYAGVHGGNFLARNGSRINKTYLNNGISGALNLSSDTKFMLEFYIKDRPLEGFWDNRKAMYEHLRELDFHTVMAPNFSLYDDAPRLEHLYNTKRSVTVYNEMIDAGLPAIPDVSWHNTEDLNIWIREINRSVIPIIGFSFQIVDVRLKASNVWKTILPGFRRLCNSIPEETQIVLSGVASPFRTSAIHQEVPQPLRILNQSAFIQSRRGMRSEGRQEELQLPRDELFLENIQYFDKTYALMNDLKQRRNGIA